MKVLVFRLEPGADLKGALDELARRHRIEAGVILTCVGSLQRATIRLAGGDVTKTWKRRFEIVSLVGTISVSGGSHLHVGLADARGAALGGHLKEGSLIFTTAEIAVGVISGTRFSREPDPRTGYHELVVSLSRSGPRKPSSRPA